MEMDKELKAIAEDSWLTHVRNYVPSAWIGHAPFMRFLIRELKPAKFDELGTYNGFSYFVACQTVQEPNLPTKTYAVDHWTGDPHAGEFDESVYEGAAALNAQFQNFSTLLKMSFLDARSKFEDGTDNLLHIDGFHTYEAVKEDFETWLPKIASNGVVVLHDIHVRHADFGVFEYWSDLKSKYLTIELTGSYGLGVVFLGSLDSNQLNNLIEISKSGNLMQIQGVFGGLSDIALQTYRNLEASMYEQKVTALNGQLTESTSYINILLNSRSWKITKPLRVATDSVGKVLRKLPPR
jgi:hypothetical protein